MRRIVHPHWTRDQSFVLGIVVGGMLSFVLYFAVKSIQAIAARAPFDKFVDDLDYFLGHINGLPLWLNLTIIGILLAFLLGMGWMGLRVIADIFHQPSEHHRYPPPVYGTADIEGRECTCPEPGCSRHWRG